jgi:glutathione S-transferase
MLRVWGRANSSNVMKVIWLLEALKLPYERIDAGGKFGTTDTPAYRAMNPTGLVPTLEDGDFVLWESNAILRYLCCAYAPDTSLYPPDIRQRASVDRWMDFQQTTLSPPMTTVFIGLIRTPEAQRNVAAIAAATTNLTRIVAIIDGELATHGHVVGEELTLADIVLGIFVHRWFTMPIEREEFPALKRWYDGLLQMPIYRTHIAIALS